MPDRKNLAELALKLGKTETDFDLVRRDKDVTGAVLRELVQYGRQLRLEKFELPGAVTVCEELWTPLGSELLDFKLTVISERPLLN